MAQLTEEAKNIISQEFREFIYENQKVLDEMSLYKWLIRILFIALLGGSIFGISKFQDYFDDRIAKRVARYDSLLLANALSSSSQFRNALEEIGSFLEKVAEEDKTIPARNRDDSSELAVLSNLSKTQRDFFYLTILETLHYIDDMEPDGNFVGGRYWRALIRDKTFLKDFIENQRWANDTKFNNRMANAYLRFSQGRDDVIKARRYFAKSLSVSANATWRAANNFGLSITSLVLGERREAVEYLFAANTERTNYVTLDALLNDIVEFPTYDRAWKILGGSDFQAQCTALFDELGQFQTSQALKAKIEALVAVEPQFKRDEFLKEATRIYLQNLAAFFRGNRRDLSQISIEAYGGFSDYIRYREELNQKLEQRLFRLKEATIMSVEASAPPTISVQFTSEQTILTSDISGQIIDGSLDERHERVDTWTFQQKLDLNGKKWIVIQVR